MKVAVFLAALSLAAQPSAAQPNPGRGSSSAPRAAEKVAEAYDQFLLAQSLEDDGDADGAIAAYKRAVAADPQSAELLSSLADLYMRQNRAADAIASAQDALKIEPASSDAHRVLGTVYGSMAMSESPRGRAPDEQKQILDKAIQHLEQSVDASSIEADIYSRAMLARLYLVDEAYDKAIALLSDLVKREPQWQDGATMLVQAYVAAGRGSEAMSWLKEAAPENPELYATLGDFYGRERKWRDAADAYAQAVDVMPRSLDVRIYYAQALLNTDEDGDVDKALEVLREALTLSANDERATLLLNQAQRRSGDLDAAEQTARRLVAQNARNPRWLVALAETLEERQRYQAVIAALAPAMGDFRTGANATVAQSLLLPHLGFAYQQVGQFDKSVAIFEDLLKLAPDDPTITSYLIQAQLAAKRYGAAATLARKMRVDHPDDLRLARLEAQALRQNGKPEEAVAILERMLQSHGDDPAAHIALAQIYNETNHSTEAVKTLELARVKFPDDETIVFELGAIFDRQKRHSDAETVFRELLDRDPSNAQVLNYLGYMLAERGERLDESVGYLKRALKIDPENGSYLDSLGWAYYKGGKFEQAAQELKRAADQLVGNSIIQDHYGDVLFKLGRYGEAIDAWNRALAGDGDSIEPKDLDKKIRAAKEKLPDR